MQLGYTGESQAASSDAGGGANTTTGQASGSSRLAVERAIKKHRDNARQAPEKPGHRFFLARSLMEAGRLYEAGIHLRAAQTLVEKQDDGSDQLSDLQRLMVIRTALNNLESKQKKQDRAVLAPIMKLLTIEEGADQPDRIDMAETLLLAAVGQDSGDPRPHLLLAKLSMKQDFLTQARTYAESARALALGDPKHSTEDTLKWFRSAEKLIAKIEELESRSAAQPAEGAGPLSGTDLDVTQMFRSLVHGVEVHSDGAPVGSIDLDRTFKGLPGEPHRPVISGSEDPTVILNRNDMAAAMAGATGGEVLSSIDGIDGIEWDIEQAVEALGGSEHQELAADTRRPDQGAPKPPPPPYVPTPERPFDELVLDALQDIEKKRAAAAETATGSLPKKKEALLALAGRSTGGTAKILRRAAEDAGQRRVAPPPPPILPASARTAPPTSLSRAHEGVAAKTEKPANLPPPKKPSLGVDLMREVTTFLMYSSPARAGELDSRKRMRQAQSALRQENFSETAAQLEAAAEVMFEDEGHFELAKQARDLATRIRVTLKEISPPPAPEGLS
jgi:hypothetical protein